MVGKLQMIKDVDGNFGIVRQMGRKKSFALKTAKALSVNLEAAGLQAVTIASHAGHFELFNVVYYKGEVEKTAKKNSGQYLKDSGAGGQQKACHRKIG